MPSAVSSAPRSRPSRENPVWCARLSPPRTPQTAAQPPLRHTAAGSARRGAAALRRNAQKARSALPARVGEHGTLAGARRLRTACSSVVAAEAASPSAGPPGLAGVLLIDRPIAERPFSIALQTRENSAYSGQFSPAEMMKVGGAISCTLSFSLGAPTQRLVSSMRIVTG
jgi:hypothetical protein